MRKFEKRRKKKQTGNEKLKVISSMWWPSNSRERNITNISKSTKCLFPNRRVNEPGVGERLTANKYNWMSD